MNTMTGMIKSLQDDLHLAQTQRNNALADLARWRSVAAGLADAIYADGYITEDKAALAAYEAAKKGTP